MLSQDRIVGLADLSMLRREWMMKNETSLIGQGERTMNLRSLDKTNLSTASIRSNGSSESLILMQEGGSAVWTSADGKLH